MKILYFAKISEDLGKSEDTLKIEKKLKVYQIIEILKKKNDKYALVFKNLSNVKFAINCEYVSKNHLISDKDELAIFPPVTGG